MGRPPKYSAGQVIHGLKLLKRIGGTDAQFRCVCGELFEARIGNVVSGNTTSCGCRHVKYHPGDSFNGIEFLKRLGDEQGRFRCTCGKVFQARVACIAWGKKVSCGCLNTTYRPGATINGLKLLRRLPPRRGEFRCKCGRKFTTRISHVACGDTKSCGCLPRGRKKRPAAKG